MTVSRLLLAGALALAATGARAAVFINEIHYDDFTAAGDVGEAIEVVATNGEDLSAYDIVLYNGSGGGTYDTDPLPVGTSASCGGTVSMGAVNYSTNGVQNGAPDGIALVLRADSTVVQFLSYEGSLTATNGPANGMTSTDIVVFETNATAPGTSLQLGGGPGSTYAEFTWNPSAAANFGSCNNGQTFAGGTDIPPTVSSTTPANNAVNVAPNANITIQFSEAVTTNPGWIALACTTSGNVAAVVSGTGSSRLLDPVPVLAFGETCTGTVVAVNVIDLDGTPDAMAANFVFSFTVQADVPPTVASTVPASNVGGVAIGSNVSIDFSEPVSVSGSWYAITCANSGAHPAVVSGGPQNYTLNPDTDFDFLELCTVNLDAALIIDQDGTPDPMASNYSWSFTSAGSPSDYYAGVDASNATALRSTLHAIIDDHTRIAYTNGTPNTWAVLNLADQDPVDTSKILDVYKNASYTKITGGTGVYNREHTWPNSLGFGDNTAEFINPPVPASQLNQPYTDTHMLYLSDTAYNSNRGNKYFGNCSASCVEDPTLLNHGQGGGSGVYPGNSNWYNSVLYEVWGKRKGDMARAMFYMDVRYEGGTHGVTGAIEPDLRLTDNPGDIINTGGNATVGYMGLLSVLLQWHIDDPVTPAEVVRNEVIQSFQGNRNPFIDHPEWVACIWQGVCTAGEDIFYNGFE